MHNVGTSQNEQTLRQRIMEDPESASKYIALSIFLYDVNRFDESVDTLREALGRPLSTISRASILTALGWRVWDATGDVEEPIRLGEQALSVVQGDQGLEA